MIENEQPVIANSLWSATANPVVPCPELQSDVSADVAIVGAGFTGLSAALHLAQMGRSVAVLEAQTPGWGASGRNGGQVNPGLIEAPNDAIARFGPEMGQRMIRLSGQAGQLVFDLIAQHQIQCDARPVGWLRAAHNPGGLRSLVQKAEQWAQHGADLQLLSRPDVVQALGTNAYIGGLIDPRGGNLHPLNYALGLCDAARAAGVRIYGQSKVEKLERRGPEHLLVTKRGQLRAGRVLLCTNGYSGPLHGGCNGPWCRSALCKWRQSRSQTNCAAIFCRGFMLPLTPAGCSPTFGWMRRGVLLWARGVAIQFRPRGSVSPKPAPGPSSSFLNWRRCVGSLSGVVTSPPLPITIRIYMILEMAWRLGLAITGAGWRWPLLWERFWRTGPRARLMRIWIFR